MYQRWLVRRSDWQFFLVGLAWLAISTQSRAHTIRTVAITGQPLPGAESEGFRGNLRLPVIDALGQVSFSATITSDSPLNDNGVWSERDGSLSLVARAGEPAVDLPSGLDFGAEASPLFEPVFNSAGQAAFVGRVLGTDVNDFNNSGIWFDNGTATHLALREGEPADGAPTNVRYGSQYYFAFRDLVFNDAGQLSFVADITGSSDPLVTEGIWSMHNGTVSLIARDGARAPGTPSGARFGSPFPDTPSTSTKSLTFTDLSLNPAGQTAFVARLHGSGVSDSNRNGIWIADSDSVDLFVRSGTQAPGTAVGTSFRAFFAVALDPAGHVALQANLTDGDVSATNDSGIWTDRGGTLALFLREGDPAPQISSTARFGGFNSSTLVQNSAGEMAFIGFLTGPDITRDNDTAIWNTDYGALSLVAREGSRAPDTVGSVFFDSFGDDSGPVFNRHGRSAFVARLAGAGVNSTNDRGIWAEDLTGELRLIAREGDLLEVAPGDLRQISFLNFLGQSGIVDGRGAGFNDLGQVVFNASFTDGTAGIFVSNLVAVPEPPAFVMLVVVGIATIVRRSHGTILQPSKLHDNIGQLGFCSIITGESRSQWERLDIRLDFSACIFLPSMYLSGLECPIARR